MSRSKSRPPRTPRRQRGDASKVPPVTDEQTHIADPWWGTSEATPAAKASVERVAADTASIAAAAASRVSARATAAPGRAPGRSTTPPRKRRVRRVRRKRAKRSLIMTMVVGVVRLGTDRVKQSARLRRIGARGIIVLIVLVGVASAVGVIMLNNVVIGRTAELGKLDTRRRELRTEQAIQAAAAAKLSAPPRVSAYARNKLHMVQPPDGSTYIYLDPANARVQPGRRIRLQRAAEQRDNEAKSASPLPATPTKEAAP